MRIGDLYAEQQCWFIETIVRLTYPVYCTTGVHDFDYHFIGSGFLLRWEKRVFFVITSHQVKLANGGTIFFAYQDAEKGIRVDHGKALGFENSDLVLSELTVDETLSNLRCVELPFLKQPESPNDLEYIVVGYQRALNTVDWENKLIQPKVGGLITNKIHIGRSTDPIELDLCTVSLSAVSNLRTFEDLTQGLSGSPVFGFKINSVSTNEADIDFHFMGVAAYVSETHRKLYAVRTYELISCLNAGFKVFSEYETAHSQNEI